MRNFLTFWDHKGKSDRFFTVLARLRQSWPALTFLECLVLWPKLTRLRQSCPALTNLQVVHSLIKNCLVLTMVDEHQKLPPHEIGTKSGHLSTQFSKELPCVDRG